MDAETIPSKRVRRSPKSAKAEIIAAFEAALAEMSFQELTVDALMQRTGMTRSSFYHYFTALDDLVLGLLEHFELDIRASVDSWLKDGSDDDYREATALYLTRMFVVFQEHRRSVAALQQAAGTNSDLYRQWQQRVVDYYIDLTAGFIRRQIQLGRSEARDPERLARALILMNNAVFNDHLARSEGEDPAMIAGVVADVWNASIYG